MEGRIEWMHIGDVLKRRAMPAIENDIVCALWLIIITWKNDSNLIVGGIGKIIVATIRGLIKAQSYLALLLWRHVSGSTLHSPPESERTPLGHSDVLGLS